MLSIIFTWGLQVILKISMLLNPDVIFSTNFVAENVAKEFQISRQEQDEYTLMSQEKTKVAQENGYFEKVV